MPLPPHANDWMRLADIDYIGPFVKAWAAFNAWYREVSGESRDREMLEYVKSQPNALRRSILGLIDSNGQTSDELNLKQAIHDLHQCLDAIYLEITRNDGGTERISFRSVCISAKPLQKSRIERYGQEFRAARIGRREIEVTVKSVSTGAVRFEYRQPRYDPDDLYAAAERESRLSAAQRTTLRRFYGECNPRPMSDLLHGEEPPLRIGGIEFHCTSEALFSGLVETIYSMRNALFHGEVDADTQLLACYEPAYRIVMQFLVCVR